MEGREALVTLSMSNPCILPLAFNEVSDGVPEALGSGSASLGSLSVDPRSSATVVYKVRLRLGKYCFGPVTLVTSDLLGFYRRTLSFFENVGGDTCITVKPRLLVEKAVFAGPLKGGAGLRGSGVLGRLQAKDSVDYYSFREYQPGDEPRLIEWKITARSSKPVVKEMAGGSTRKRMIIILLTSKESWRRVAGEDSEHELAVRAAYNIHRAAASSGFQTTLVAPAASTIYYRGSEDVGEMLAELDPLPESRVRSVALEPVEEALSEAGSDSKIIIVSSIDYEPSEERMARGRDYVVVSTRRGGNYLVRGDRDIVKVIQELSQED